MPENWQPGDLALCVRGGHIAGSMLVEGWPAQGAVYRVRSMIWDKHWNDLFLVLPEAPPNNCLDHAWAAARFRKITPLTEEEREQALRDFSAPAPVPA